MKALLLLLLIATTVSAQGSLSSSTSRRIARVTFANLGGAANGEVRRCTNCGITAGTGVCTSGGSGAWAYGNGTNWICSTHVPSAGGVTSVTGTSPIASSGGTTPAISLNDTAVTPGSYTSANITVDQKGRITAAANGSGGGVTNSAGNNVVPKSDGTNLVASGISDDGTTITTSEAITQTSASATAFQSGPNGGTNPVFRLVNNTGSQKDGLSITGGLSGVGPTLSALSDGANAPVTVAPKGTGAFAVFSTGVGTLRLFSSGSSGDVSYDAATDNLTIKNNAAHGGSATFGRLDFSPGNSLKWVMQNDGHLVANTDNTIDIGAAGANRPRNLYLGTGLGVEATITAGGTTGAQTINKAAGSVNFAAGASTLVVTNSLVTANSLVFAVVQTNDATAVIKSVAPTAGSFTITLNAATTGETKVGFFVVQPD